MAIKQRREGRPGGEQGLGVDVGAQAGTGRLVSQTARAAGVAAGHEAQGSADEANPGGADESGEARGSGIGAYQGES